MKIGFLITARLKSTRLPSKVIKDLNGRTVIERIIDRIKEIRGVSSVVLCTSGNTQDKPLIEIAKSNGIDYFIGSADDVLQRLLDAAKLFKLDYFLGITADNPLISIRHSDLIVHEVKKNKFDFIKVEGLPIGCATCAIRVKALETVCKIKTVIDTEIWGALIDRPEVFNIKKIKARGKLNRPELRFTLDYAQDLEFIRNIYSSVPFERVVSLSNVIDYLDDNPEVAKINQDCIQLQLDEKIKKKIEQDYRENLEKFKEIKNKIYNS